MIYPQHFQVANQYDRVIDDAKKVFQRCFMRIWNELRTSEKPVCNK